MEINSKQMEFPQITLMHLRKNKVLNDARRKLGELERQHIENSARAMHLVKVRQDLEKQWQDALKVGCDTEAVQIKAQMDAAHEESVRLGSPTAEADEAYLDAMAEFVFEAVKITDPTMTKDAFENSFDVDSLWEFYNTGYLRKKKQRMNVAEASVAVELLSTMKSWESSGFGTSQDTDGTPIIDGLRGIY